MPPASVGYINIQMYQDQIVEQLGIVGEQFVNDATNQMARAIPSVIRFEIIPAVIDIIADEAGDAFPRAYRWHLKDAMMGADVATVNLGGILEATVHFNGLGDRGDFERGYHDHALIDTGVDKSTKIKKKDFVIHPGQVQLPYSGEDLLNDTERRTEVWEEGIASGAGIFVSNVKSGKGFRSYPMPSVEEVANRRVAAWSSMGVAPEWLILEYGTANAEPNYSGGSFTYRLNSAINCYLRRYFDYVLESAIEAAEFGARVTSQRGSANLQLRAAAGEHIGQSRGGQYISPSSINTPVTFNGVPAISIWECL